MLNCDLLHHPVFLRSRFECVSKLAGRNEGRVFFTRIILQDFLNQTDHLEVGPLNYLTLTLAEEQGDDIRRPGLPSRELGLLHLLDTCVLERRLRGKVSLRFQTRQLVCAHRVTGELRLLSNVFNEQLRRKQALAVGTSELHGGVVQDARQLLNLAAGLLDLEIYKNN